MKYSNIEHDIKDESLPSRRRRPDTHRMCEGLRGTRPHFTYAMPPRNVGRSSLSNICAHVGEPSLLAMIYWLGVSAPVSFTARKCPSCCVHDNTLTSPALNAGVETGEIDDPLPQLLLLTSIHPLPVAEARTSRSTWFGEGESCKDRRIITYTLIDLDPKAYGTRKRTTTP